MGVRLMVVDDHRLLAEALASALKLRGHRVLAAAAPGGAAELVISRAPEVCLLGTATPANQASSTRWCGSRGSDRRSQWWCSVRCRALAGSPPPSRRGPPAMYGTTSGSRASNGPWQGPRRGGSRRAAAAAQSFAELLNPAAELDDEGARLLQMLTPREVEVLVRVTEGEDTRLIAAAMDIAPSTARTHVQRVLMKLGVGSRLEAAALAARTGLLERAGSPGSTRE